MKTALAAILIAFAGAVGAQGSNDMRGTVPHGTAADGSRPADGAITGGSIRPGERSGVPTSKPSAGVSLEERIRRCEELIGTLRDDCLRKERNSGAGGTRGEMLPPLKPELPSR
jgi:hypothetical protein